MARDENRLVKDQRPRYDCLLFDLDDTLYPLSSGLALACTKNIADFVNQKLGIEKNRIPELCRQLYTTYGTSMAGLRAVGYELDYDDYHSFVHGRLPYANLKPDPVLKNLLLSMPQRKIVNRNGSLQFFHMIVIHDEGALRGNLKGYFLSVYHVKKIFTNGDKVHAAKVLKGLGLEDCFEGIICFETLNPPSQTTANNNHLDIPAVNSVIPKTPVVCKPSKEAIRQAIRLAKADPQRTIFFDDSPRNIAAGKREGLHTVLVGTPVRTEGADFALESIHNIREALPEIWEEDAESSKNVRQSTGATAAIETVVTA